MRNTKPLMKTVGGQESQGYFLFEFETVIGLRNTETGDFRLMKRIPDEASKDDN